MSILDGSIRKAIGAAFKGQLRTGALTRQTQGSVDEYGDPIPGAPEEFAVEGFVSNYDEAYRAAAGIPLTDVKVVLILENCETQPLKDDIAQFSDWGSFKLRNVRLDPDKASAVCQAFKTS
jgi:hypothetical protein